jgi:hypothetical protein
VFASKDKEIAAAGGGKVFLFDSGFLANGPIATSPSTGAADFDAGALASWQDAGRPLIATPSARGIVATKVSSRTAS